MCDERFVRVYGQGMRINGTVAVATTRIPLAHFSVVYCALKKTLMKYGDQDLGYVI